MAAFKRKDRPSEGYRIWPTLPRPFGRVGPWQTGTQQKRTADAMEAYVVECAVSRPEVVEGLVRGDYSLKELWIAKVRSTAGIDRVTDLLQGAVDPLLADAAASYSRLTSDGRVRDALPQLATLADQVVAERAIAARKPVPRPGTQRLSWLLTASNVTEIYAAAGRVQSPASVRRSVHRAVTELLAHHHGKARVRALMLDVKKPEVSDEREVRVSADEVRALLDSFDPEFQEFVALAILLAVDRGPLTRIRPRFFSAEAGTLEVLDTKTSHRARTLTLPLPAIRILERVCAGRRVDELVFPWSDGAIRHRWETGRDIAAGQPSRSRRERGQGRGPDASGNVVTLATLRFKDLRHLLPTTLNALGVPEAEIQRILGHAHGSKETRRYITAVGAREHMDAAARALGLDRMHLKVG